MSTESLAAMNVAELKHERNLAKLNRVQIQLAMKGANREDRNELELAVRENREYIEIINARIARLERVGRN